MTRLPQPHPNPHGDVAEPPSDERPVYPDLKITADVLTTCTVRFLAVLGEIFQDDRRLLVYRRWDEDPSTVRIELHRKPRGEPIDSLSVDITLREMDGLCRAWLKHRLKLINDGIEERPDWEVMLT